MKKYFMILFCCLFLLSVSVGCQSQKEVSTAPSNEVKQQQNPLDTLQKDYFEKTELKPVLQQELPYTITTGHFLMGNPQEEAITLYYPQIESISALKEEAEQNEVIERIHDDFEKTSFFRKGAFTYFLEHITDPVTQQKQLQQNLFANTNYRVQTANEKIVSVFYEESISYLGKPFDYSAVGVTVSLEENRLLELSEMITDFEALFTLLETDQFTPMDYWEEPPLPFSEILKNDTHIREEWIEILKNNNKKAFFVEGENDAEILWESREFEWYLWDHKLVLVYLGENYYQQYFIELEKIRDMIDDDFYQKYIVQNEEA